MELLKGKVKFFDAEKGYGYICDLENTEHDYKVTIANVIGLEPPKQGDTVSFEAKTIPENGKKGVAVSVRIEESSISESNAELKQGQKKGDFVLSPDSKYRIINGKLTYVGNTCPRCKIFGNHRLHVASGKYVCLNCTHRYKYSVEDLNEMNTGFLSKPLDPKVVYFVVVAIVFSIWAIFNFKLFIFK